MSHAPPPSSLDWARALGRRAWLRVAGLAVGFGLLAGAGWMGWRIWRPHATVHAGDHDAALVSRLVDLFVPRDDSPGAIDLGLQIPVLAALRADPQGGEALGLLAAALDRMAGQAHGRRFMSLSPDQQDQLLRRWAPDLQQRQGDADDDKAARVLMHLRDRCMSLYYARPESWPTLGIARPPQPLGYMDYREAPRGQ